MELIEVGGGVAAIAVGFAALLRVWHFFRSDPSRGGKDFIDFF